MEIASTVIASFALVFSITAFIVTFVRGRKLEEIKMTHEILKNFYETENRAVSIEYDDDPLQWKLRHLQYLNMWEWFSFLVNHKRTKK